MSWPAFSLGSLQLDVLERFFTPLLFQMLLCRIILFIDPLPTSTQCWNFHQITPDPFNNSIETDTIFLHFAEDIAEVQKCHNLLEVVDNSKCQDMATQDSEPGFA